MKNYIVKALFNFNDVEEKNEFGCDTPRIANKSVWHCTKERFEYLKSKNAVMLIGIDEIKKEVKEKPVEEVKEVVKEQPIEVEKPKAKPKATKKKISKK